MEEGIPSQQASNPPPFDHELGLTELFDRTWKLVAQNYSRVLPIFVIAGLVVGLISVAFSPYTVPPNVSLTASASSSNVSASLANLSAAIGPTITYAAFVFLEYFLILAILYFACGISIRFMDENWKNRKDFKMTQVYPTVEPKINYVNLFITTFVAAFIIFLGVYVIFIGSLLFATWLYFSLVASAVEGKGALQALGRSTELVSGRWKKTFVTLTGSFLFVYFVGYFFGALATIIYPNVAVDSFITFFGMALVFPVIGASMLVLYYSPRKPRTALQAVQTTNRSPYDSMRPSPVGVFKSPPHPGYCPRCGVSVSREERFCHNCGKQLATD